MTTSTGAPRVPDEDHKAAYEHLRAAHLKRYEHRSRTTWCGSNGRISESSTTKTERLRSLLAFARERSPFHAARMADIDPAMATVDEVTLLPGRCACGSTMLRVADIAAVQFCASLTLRVGATTTSATASDWSRRARFGTYWVPTR